MTADPAAVTTIADLTYYERDGFALRADLHVPRRSAGRPSVIVWLHGGGWRYGSRKMAPDLVRFFAGQGFAMAAIDYSLSDRACFPAQVEDIKIAIRWLRVVAEQYGFDGDRIGLWGASAGGHVAAIAALSGPGIFEPPSGPYANQSSRVDAVAAGYPPVDFLRLDADRPAEDAVSIDPENLPLPPGMRSADADSFESLLLGAPIGTCPDRVREANPVTYVHRGAPPFLILHGSSDTTVGSRQSELLFEALAALDNDVTLCLIDRLGHGFLNRSHLDEHGAWPMTMRSHRAGCARVERVERPIFTMIEGFFRRTLEASGER